MDTHGAEESVPSEVSLFQRLEQLSRCPCGVVCMVVMPGMCCITVLKSSVSLLTALAKSLCH